MRKLVDFIKQLLGAFQIPFGWIDQPQSRRNADDGKVDFYGTNGDHSHPFNPPGRR